AVWLTRRSGYPALPRRQLVKVSTTTIIVKGGPEASALCDLDIDRTGLCSNAKAPRGRLCGCSWRECRGGCIESSPGRRIFRCPIALTPPRRPKYHSRPA